jgi:hypothetical protein
MTNKVFNPSLVIMNKSLKGGGELSRKILAILLASGMVSTGAWANDVYMEQIGDNSTVSITQTGAGNIVNGNVGGTGNDTDAALIQGDLNTVTVSQIGASNTLRLQLNNSSNGTGATVTATADGSNNDQTISCGSALTSNCNASLISSEITGNSNITTQTLSGNTLSSKISVTGSYNTVTHTASGAGLHTGDITVTGSGVSGALNAVILTQSGASAKNAVITSTGSSNSISVTQSD